MNKLQSRIKQYSKIATRLAGFSNVQLKQILANAQPIGEGIGGKKVLIHVDNINIFVKKVPLIQIEQLPQNFMSTANLFNLSLNY